MDYRETERIMNKYWTRICILIADMMMAAVVGGDRGERCLW